MPVQNSIAVRNAMLDAIETTIGVSARLQFYTGSAPANCAAAATGTQLLNHVLASDWAAAAASGSKAFNGTPIATTANGNGTVGYYRITDNAGSTCHEQGTVTATGGGGDMTIDNVVIASGQTINITGFTKTAPGA